MLVIGLSFTLNRAYPLNRILHSIMICGNRCHQIGVNTRVRTGYVYAVRKCSAAVS